MIVCRKCSRQHPDGTDFCACGAFLEFDGERVADEHPATPVASPEAPVDAGRRPSGGHVRATAGSDAAPWSGLGGQGNWTDTPDSIGVKAQLPDEPDTVRPPDQVVVQPTGRAGDISCERCGTPNAPERQFCQHCGQALSIAMAGAASPVTARARPKVSWWRRLTRRIPDTARTTDPRQLAVQARRLSRGGLSPRSMLFRSGGVMVIVAALLAFVGPWGGTARRWSRDRIGATSYTEVDLDGENVSEEPNPSAATPKDFPLQGPERLVDDASNTVWATHWLDINNGGPEEEPRDCQVAAGTDSWLVITFPKPTDLNRIHVLGGRSAEEDLNRDAYLRPKFVQVRINEKTCEHLPLKDEGVLQGFEFDHSDVEQLDLRIVAVHGAPDALSTVEISELVLES